MAGLFRPPPPRPGAAPSPLARRWGRGGGAGTIVVPCTPARPGPVATDRIRNFSIISHVDHGKSTLSDRILELTGAVDPRFMREQYLDSMDIERERGITIKAQNVRVHYADHILHLIDTPGHVDFGYEVSRSLAACEGAVLLVDASQGIQAQTLANCYQAMEHDLEIVPVLNKIDLPAADPSGRAEIEQVLGLPDEDILHISRQDGRGGRELLDAIVARIPPPKGDPTRAAACPHLRLLLRPVPRRGELHPDRRRHAARRGGLRFMQANTVHDVEEVGVRTPDSRPGRRARPGRGRLPHRRDQGRQRGALG